MSNLPRRLRTVSGRTGIEAADALEKQQAEIEGWKADQKENLANQCELQAEINALKAKAAKDAADAERYRWLCEHSDSISLAPRLTVARVKAYGLEGWSGDDLDEAIDAAMKESQQ